MSGNQSTNDQHIENDAFTFDKDVTDRDGTPLSSNTPNAAFRRSNAGSENSFSSKSRSHDVAEDADDRAPVDTPQQQALVSRSVTVGTSTPKIASLSAFPNNAISQEQRPDEDLEELEAETSSLLQSRFRRSSPLSWQRTNDDVDLPEPPFQWQNSGGTYTSSIPIPTAIRHNDRQFSIESLLSIGSFDSIHEAVNSTPSRRGSLQSSPGTSVLERTIDDFCQQNLHPQGLRPLNLGRQSSLASLGDVSMQYKEMPDLKPSLSSSTVAQVDAPFQVKKVDPPAGQFRPQPINRSASEDKTPHAKTTREMMLQNAARAAAGLPPLMFGQEEDMPPSSGPAAKASADFWSTTQRPAIVDRVSSANANWELYGYSPAAAAVPGAATNSARPARPTHLKNRGRSRSNVTFSDPPAVEMEESNTKPVAAAAAAPKPVKMIRKQTDGAQPMLSSNASTDWSHNSASSANTSPGSAIKELPTSALQEWLSSGTPITQKDQAASTMPMPMQAGMFQNDWKHQQHPQHQQQWGPPGMYSAHPPPGSFDPEMYAPYGPPGMMPPYMARGNMAYAVPVPMMWGPQQMPNDRSRLSNRGRGPGQPPKRFVSAGPYPTPYPVQGGYNSFPPAFPYKRSASAPEDTSNMDFAKKWAKMGSDKTNNNGAGKKSAPARVKREKSSREIPERKSKAVQFGHPHVEVLEGRRIYSRHTLFLLGAHRSDIAAVNGNTVDGCDSLLLCNMENPQRKDDLAMLKFGCSSRGGGCALYASHVKNLPVRVFRKHENGKSQGFRYDGLYSVIAMFDESGSPRSELPAMAHERVEFLLRRNPHMAPKEASATMVEANSAFSNRLSIDELWEHVSKTITGGRELNKSSSFQGDKVLPEHCDSNSSGKRPHSSSLQKSKSESNPSTSRPSRPAALNTRPRATSAEVALLHIRYFSPEDDEEDSTGNAHEASHGTLSGLEHSQNSKRQKQSHKNTKSGELSPEMISDAIGRLFHQEGTTGGEIETSIQKTTVALSAEGMSHGLFEGNHYA